MSNHARGRRRYRKTQGRRVWAFSELNHQLRPDQIAKIITAAGLEQARLETAAQADDARRTEEKPPASAAEGGDHA